MPSQTTALSLLCSLYSGTGQAPPFEMSDVSGTISYNNAPDVPFEGWSEEGLATPIAGGASFTLAIQDMSYSASYVANVANWALTFIPRGATSQQSPFGNNQNTISGNGATRSDGLFTLNTGNVKIKNTGDWDWALMVQMVLPNGSVECFCSDPEMEVGS
jgi:hypothetical protein